MKPTAYISEHGVVFKELPPNPMFNLTPLYTKEAVVQQCIEQIALVGLLYFKHDNHGISWAIQECMDQLGQHFEIDDKELKDVPYESDFVKHAKIRLQAGEE
jgi:hypothetical protein